MNAADFDAFQQEFRRVSAALERFKATPEQQHQRADAYFHVLKRFSLAEVCAKADAWLTKQTKFPAPAEWAGQIISLQRIELRTLSDAESRDYLRADRLNFEDDPCRCADCLAADLPNRPENRLRYVPLEDGDGVQKARNAMTGAIVTPGRWIHGWELVRWYKARADFWATAYARVGVGHHERKKLEKVPFHERLERLFSTAKEMVQK